VLQQCHRTAHTLTATARQFLLAVEVLAEANDTDVLNAWDRYCKDENVLTFFQSVHKIGHTQPPTPNPWTQPREVQGMPGQTRGRTGGLSGRCV
jgi:hypothetical protein